MWSQVDMFHQRYCSISLVSYTICIIMFSGLYCVNSVGGVYKYASSSCPTIIKCKVGHLKIEEEVSLLHYTTCVKNITTMTNTIIFGGTMCLNKIIQNLFLSWFKLVMCIVRLTCAKTIWLLKTPYLIQVRLWSSVILCLCYKCITLDPPPIYFG